ncbi:MAG: hypothetical protein CSA62_10950 [Planctomycetota bacterium]|nr:MAG: hypothetical protein CSA62_10950 [Planctomycetota bacterium]
MGSGSDAGDLISIGELAQRTGISIDTLRAWERRYGEPKPLRLPSGHRRYSKDQLRRLMGVSEALAHGLRPSRFLGQPPEVLERILEELSPRTPNDPTLDTLLEYVQGYERGRLERELVALWQRFPVVQWLQRFVVPLLATVGRLWAEGQITIRQEHFMSEVLEDLLRMLRLELLSDQIDAGTAPILLTSLPGERHALGLQMVALLCAAQQVPQRLMGADMPVAEIVAAARDCAAKVVAVSVSLASGGPHAGNVLYELREQLPSEVHILVGGRGARGSRRCKDGVEYLDSLPDFVQWLESQEF